MKNRMDVYSDGIEALRPTVITKVNDLVDQYRRGQVDELVFMWNMEKLTKSYNRVCNALSDLVDPDWKKSLAEHKEVEAEYAA